MFSTEGLSHGEIIVVSGIFAFGMLAITSVIGAIVAHIATREPRVVAARVPAPAPMPAPVPAPSAAMAAG